MAISRRALGYGLLGLGMAGTAGVHFALPALEGLAPPEAVTLAGFYGGEKEDFIRNPKVVARLRDRYGITLNGRRMGSVEMVSQRAQIDTAPPQWLWPASNILVPKARQTYTVRQEEIVFNSPIVLYSWTPIVEKLEAAGFVERRDGAWYLLKMKELVEAVDRRAQWAEVGLPELGGSIVINSTDPRQSNSGYMFAGLLANIFAGDVATLDGLAQILPRIDAIFDRMGAKTNSSGTLWNEYLNQGMAGRRLVVGYESQLIEFILAQPELWRRLQTQGVRPVTLYPAPTVYSSHPIVSLAEPADRLVPALVEDAELQELAWNEHGFRGRLGAIGGGGPSVEGIPAQVSGVIPMPDAAVMDAILQALG